MTSFARRHAREITRGIVHLWWVFVIVMPLVGFALWLAVDHANANAARQQRQTNAKFARQQQRSNQQFRQSQILANRKFQQAIRIAIAQGSYSTNKSVCTLRPFLQAALQARQAAVKDAKNDADRKLNQDAVDTYKKLLEGQVTVPADFDCADLPKNPPKATP